MFISIYIYRVPRENVGVFLRVQRDASEIYRRHGAIDDVTFAPVNLEAKYGCAGFTDALDIREEEEVLIGLSSFHDRPHHDTVMAQVDRDERISELYEAVASLLDVGRVVRGEFERVE
jgi:uncharacterized protein YbaA (DUF1428 family)